MGKKHKKLTACAVVAMLGLSCMVYPVHAEEACFTGQAETDELLELDETTVPVEESTQPEVTEQTNGEAEPQEQTETVNTLSSARINNISYIDENGNTQTAKNVTEVTESNTTWSSGWYVVNSNIQTYKRFTVSGDVKLILADGYTLEANGNLGGDESDEADYGGITVNSGNSLTIYGQLQGTGKLIAHAKNTGEAAWSPAGIGGGDYKDAGSITINGGIIDAAGGGIQGAGAAGIGGGWVSSGGTVTINGGVVTAKGSPSGDGAGIGGGDYNQNGSVIINGGIVNVQQGGEDSNYGLNDLSSAADGNAIIFADSIKNSSDTSSWSGVIFQGNSGKVYTTGGNKTITIDESFEIPQGYTLTIPNGTTLTIPDGVTITNNGTIVIENGGAINGIENITGNGTIKGLKAPTPTVTIDTSKTTASSITVNELTDKDAYGGAEYKIDDKKWQDSNVFTNLSAGKSYSVYARYKGNDTYVTSDIGTTDVSTSAASYTITIPANPDSPLVAGKEGSTSTISVNQENSFDLGYNGQVDVKVKNDDKVTDKAELNLTRQNDIENHKITSALLVNGKALGNVNISIATFKAKNDSPVTVSFAKPTETNIPAGTYNGTITFEVSYSEQ